MQLIKTAPEQKRKEIKGYFNIKISLKNSFPIEFDEQLSDECEECIEEYEGEIFFNSDSNHEETKIGKFKFGILNAIRSQNARFSSADTFDIGGEPFEYYQVVYKYNSYDFNDFLERAIGDEGHGNAGYISTIEILPEYRGMELGKKVLKSILNFLQGKVEVVVLKSFPIQFSSAVIHADENDSEKEWYNSMGYYEKQRSEFEAQKSLDNYYLSCGFSKIKLPKDWINKTDSCFGLNLNYVNHKL